MHESVFHTFIKELFRDIKLIEDIFLLFDMEFFVLNLVLIVKLKQNVFILI